MPPASWREQHVARRQRRQAGDAVRLDAACRRRRAPRTATVRYGRTASRKALGERGLVAAAEGDRGGALEQLASSPRPASCGGDLRQPVLDDPVRDALAAQLAADRADVRDGEAAVVGHDRGLALESPRPAPRRWPLGLRGHDASFPGHARRAGDVLRLVPREGVGGAASQRPVGGVPVRRFPCLGVPVGVPRRCRGSHGPVDDFGPVRHAGRLDGAVCGGTASL